MAKKQMSREQSRAQTKERLLAAASELFVRHGVNAASLEQIAERAGYTRGAIYSNFGGKEDIVLALLEHRTQQEFAEINKIAAAAESFADTLDALRRWHQERAKNLTAWLTLRTELWLYALHDDRVRARFAEREIYARRAIAGGIKHLFTEADAQPPADLDFLALIVHALEDGLLMQRLIFPEEIPDEVVVDATALLCNSWLAQATRT